MRLNYKLIGIRIKEIRKFKKITQIQLAELADLSVSYISYIESAKKKASLQTLVDIAEVMGVTVDLLLSGNQKSNHRDYQHELWGLIEDCTNYEKRIIYEQMVSLKNSLRDHACLLTAPGD